MKLDQKEKDFLIQLLQEQLEAVQEHEKHPHPILAEYAGELEHEDFLKNLLKKLKE